MNLSNILVNVDVRKPIAQHSTAERIYLDGGLRDEAASALQPQVEAADTGEQRKDAQLPAHIAPTLLRMMGVAAPMVIGGVML